MPRSSSLCRLLSHGLVAAALAAAPASVVVFTASDASAQPAPKPEDVKKATDAFKAGTTLFQQKKWSQALEKFTLSYQTVPSPNSALYIARCYAELGQLKDAFEQFKKTIAEATVRAATEPKYAPTRDSAVAELDELSKKLPVLTVNVRNGEGATLRVQGIVVNRPDWGTPMVVSAGPVEVVIESSTGKQTKQTVNVIVGKAETITIEPEVEISKPIEQTQPDEEGGSSPLLPVAIAFGVVGVLGMGTFAAGGVMSMQTESELQDQCGDARCTDPATNDTIDRGEKEQLAANVGVTIGAVGLGAAAAFLIVYLVSGDSESPTKEAAVQVRVGPGFVGVGGTF